MQSLLVVGGVVVGVLIFLFIIFKISWRVAEPNEALVISGWGSNTPDGVAESLGFKIAAGKGAWVGPGARAGRRLSLDRGEAELAIDCAPHRGTPLGLKGVAIFKVGDDSPPTPTPPRRFLDQQEQMDHRVHN